MGRGTDLIRQMIYLAAAPIFGVMALLTGLSSGDPVDILCAATHGTSWGIPWLTGMAPMYALMSAVHLPPWLRLMSAR